jgi:pyruvate dehydrogenase E1 component
LFHEWKQKSLSYNNDIEKSHLEHLLKKVPQSAKVITILDGHPLTLAWIGGIYGHKIVPLGVDQFGQTGTINDLYSEFKIDTESICQIGFNQN